MSDIIRFLTGHSELVSVSEHAIKMKDCSAIHIFPFVLLRDNFDFIWNHLTRALIVYIF